MLNLLPHSPYALAVFALLPLAALLAHFSSRRRTRLYPPGPPGHPFIGHLLELARRALAPHIYYKELNDKYGANCFVDILSSRPSLVNL